MYSVYILRSLKNGKSYIGYTSKEVGQRLEEHNIGSNVWTGQNRPFKIACYKSFFCKQDGMHRERFYKTGIGRSFIKLIISNNGE
jgi:putative endonuclease